MRKCVVPGSFDPFTIGHFDIVVRASKLFDKVYVAIMVNSDKKGMLDFSQRKKIAELSCANLPNVEVITAGGTLVDLCRALGACAIVKGVRNTIDFDYEKGLASMNRHLAFELETVFLPATPDYDYISSSFAREVIKYGKSLDGIVKGEAIKALREMTATPDEE